MDLPTSTPEICGKLRDIAKHGVSFDVVSGFEWDQALDKEDTRADYGEKRFNALAPIGDRLHHLTYTPRDGRVRVISLRRANKRERTLYEET